MEIRDVTVPLLFVCGYLPTLQCNNYSNSDTMSILNIHARQVFDSRGNPTVEVDVTTDKGLFRGAVPSGASTGILLPGSSTSYVN